MNIRQLLRLPLDHPTDDVVSMVHHKDKVLVITKYGYLYEIIDDGVEHHARLVKTELTQQGE